MCSGGFLPHLLSLRLSRHTLHKSLSPWAAVGRVIHAICLVQVQTLNGEEHEALPLTLEGGLLAMMAEVTQEAERAVSGIAGATVEDNTYCVSIHFRNCSMQDWPKVCSSPRMLSSCIFECMPPPCPLHREAFFAASTCLFQ